MISLSTSVLLFIRLALYSVRIVIFCRGPPTGNYCNLMAAREEYIRLNLVIVHKMGYNKMVSLTVGPKWPESDGARIMVKWQNTKVGTDFRLLLLPPSRYFIEPQQQEQQITQLRRHLIIKWVGARPSTPPSQDRSCAIPFWNRARGFRGQSVTND